MNYLIKWCSVLFLLVPTLALADPVTINASATGMVRADSPWLNLFTGVTRTGAEIPFTYSLSGQFDPDSADYFAYTDSNGQFAFQSNPQSVMTLTVDGSTYTINGGSYLNATMRPDRYVLELRFGHSSYAFTTTLEFRHPDGFPGGPLTSRELIADTETTAHFSFIASPWNPDAPGSWDAFGQLDTALLSVSPVPEPSHSAMLACGLLILLARFASLGWRNRP